MSNEAVTTPAQGMIFCATCGEQIAFNAPTCVKCGAPNAAVAGQTSNSSMIVAALLCFFLGGFGAHRFYAGRITSGILMLVILIVTAVIAMIPVINLVSPVLALILSVWVLVDFIRILIGSFKDGQGLSLKR